MRFSANLRFLWADLPLPAAVRAAKDAGFHAVECHCPYGTPAPAVRAALDETGLEMLGLNTQRGPPGENGLAALPGRAQDARAAIEEAVHYAIATRSRSVHVMAGFAAGPVAHAAFVDNLRFACAMAQRSGISILIEPLNRHDAPGYFLTSTDQARDIIMQIAAPNLRLMFDCYHVQRSEGDVTHRLVDLLPIVGHIQFASVPDRSPPDQGELNYAHVFRVVSKLGYASPLGAEYKPKGRTGSSLKWMTAF